MCLSSIEIIASWIQVLLLMHLQSFISLLCSTDLQREEENGVQKQMACILTQDSYEETARACLYYVSERRRSQSYRRIKQVVYLLFLHLAVLALHPFHTGSSLLESYLLLIQQMTVHLCQVIVHLMDHHDIKVGATRRDWLCLLMLC